MLTESQSNPPANGRHDPYKALRSRDFRLLLTGRFITSFGNEMLTFAIAWELWLRTRSAFALGMVGLVQVVPVILLSLPGGHVADQHNRRIATLPYFYIIISPDPMHDRLGRYRDRMRGFSRVVASPIAC